MGSMEHTQKDFTCNRWTEIDPMENQSNLFDNQ